MASFQPFLPRIWKLAHGRSLELGPKAKIMAVLNVTPDSFSDGGDHLNRDVAIAQAKHMQSEGADIVDIGGETTKPNAEPIDGATEQQRILTVIGTLAAGAHPLISVDTYRAETAQFALEAGAHIVNDIWGCQKEPAIAEVAASSRAGLVIMNNRREREVLDDLIEDATRFLTRSLEIATRAGVKPDRIVLDPGFGFAATVDHDIPLLAGLERLQSLEFPILVGTSRKRFLGVITGRDPKDRAAGTVATSVVARLKGAALFRVHDIGVNKDALAVSDAVIKQGQAL